jgi:hypothetical protein
MGIESVPNWSVWTGIDRNGNRVFVISTKCSNLPKTLDSMASLVQMYANN